ncbi:MAG: alanine racemase [Saccharofermentanales bacterium]
MSDYLLNRSWAQVNLDSIAHNVRILRRIVKRNAEIMGVVKADAYGHGTKQVVPVLLRNGATRLAVSMLDEAIELRKNGVEVPILILGYTDPRRSDEIIEYNVTQTVYSMDLAFSLSEAGIRAAREVRIHIKVDTGMGRVGFMSGFEAVKQISEIGKMRNIVIEGLYTHFASADEESPDYTMQQFEKFMSICNELGRLGIQIPIKHVCNSAAAARYPFMHLDMVRAGILLYGMSPSPAVNAAGLGFRPAMTLKANIVLIKKTGEGQPISYGRTFTTSRESVIATIPIGYADGYSRTLSNKAEVLIKGERYPVVGTVCMDTCMADITDAQTEISTGDEVVLFGSSGAESIDIDEIASLMGTINYEVTCLIGKRVPRVYTDDTGIREIENYLLH